jgi:pimeloyl-ACP methyl ester carboxylesterase
MQSGFLSYHNSTIYYRRGGQGPQPLICFHGYGETAASFDFLEKKLGASHTIIAIDMPFHGQTQWNGPQPDAAMLADITQALLSAFDIHATHIQLMGFSMGGRMALCVLQQIPQNVSRLVLLAPDGLTVNFWYWLSTQTSAGNKLFRLTMHRPGWFLGMLRGLNKMRIINQSIYKFVEFYIHDDAVRKALYERWTGLGKCTPSIKKLRRILQQHAVSVWLLYGKFDRIISHETGGRLFNGVPNCRIEVLNCGHQVLHEKNADAICNALLS